MKKRKPHLPPGTKWMLRKIDGPPQTLWLEIFGWSIEWGASPSHLCPYFDSFNISDEFHWSLYTRFTSRDAGIQQCVLEEVELGDDGRYAATGRTLTACKPPPKLGAREAGRRALDLLERISRTEWAAEAAFRGAPEMADLVRITMRQWEQEDQQRTDLGLKMAQEEEDRRFLEWASEVASAPGKSTKNVSPYRVRHRRQKNKAARAARRRNRNKKVTTPYKINIHTVAACFVGDHGERILHSFDDFLETCGAPMDADGNDELELFDDRAWLVPTAEPFHYRLNQVFAEFKDRRGNISFHSLMGIHEGGLPACEEDDDLLDLNSEQVFVMEHDGSFVVLLGPGEEP